MNSAQDTVNKSLQEISEHAVSAFTDPKVMPYYMFAMATIATSVGLFIAGKRHESLFVGLWPPTIMAMAILSRMSRSVPDRVLQ
jgi:hypothetical protein